MREPQLNFHTGFPAFRHKLVWRDSRGRRTELFSYNQCILSLLDLRVQCPWHEDTRNSFQGANWGTWWQHFFVATLHKTNPRGVRSIQWCSVVIQKLGTQTGNAGPNTNRNAEFTSVLLTRPTGPCCLIDWYFIGPHHPTHKWLIKGNVTLNYGDFARRLTEASNSWSLPNSNFWNIIISAYLAVEQVLFPNSAYLSQISPSDFSDIATGRPASQLLRLCCVQGLLKLDGNFGHLSHGSHGYRLLLNLP